MRRFLTLLFVNLFFCMVIAQSTFSSSSNDEAEDESAQKQYKPSTIHGSLGTATADVGDSAALPSARTIKTGTQSYAWSAAPRGETRAPEPAPMMSGSMVSAVLEYAAPITVWNEWPDNVSNRSVFYYLRENDPFSVFVKTWYKSSCALVVYDDTERSYVIGSGTYLSGHKITTARHCFEAYPFVESLYARFFDYYEVNASGIKARFMDVPILGVKNAKGGLDATYLYLGEVNGEFRRYAKPLTVADDDPTFRDPFATLPPGSYAMFHFAGGIHHQISIGHVPVSTVGTPLDNNIPISAGDGASGATIIRSTSTSDVRGYGISVYRDRLDERRIIPFAKFENPGWQDSISAPYSLSSSFPILSSGVFDLTGYEYLCWKVDFVKQGKGGGGHPKNVIYDTAPGHKNHHIIPRTDLWFLWMYVFDSDVETDADVGNPNYAKLKEQITLLKTTNPSLDHDACFAAYSGKYETIQKQLMDLCPEWRTPKGVLDKSAKRSRGFAWSQWNLFKGPGDRNDDPKNDPTFDFSEKKQPSGFDARLWDVLKDSTTGGLYYRIKKLKMDSRTHLPNIAILDELIIQLDLLTGLWNAPGYSRNIYAYDSRDWTVNASGTYALN